MKFLFFILAMISIAVAPAQYWIGATGYQTTDPYRAYAYAIFYVLGGTGFFLLAGACIIADAIKLKSTNS